MDTILLPRHIAIIMDGNGRWAQARGLPRLAGHKAGLDAVREIIKSCAEKKIEVLSLFAFSSENWRRPPKEVSFLFDLFLQSLTHEIKDLHKNNIRLKFIGDRRAFSKELIKSMDFAEQLTANNTGLTVINAINYGGKWDITQALQTIAHKITQGEIALADLNEQLVNSHLMTQDLPAPDLFIRTSGEQRISNFFLWQLAYTEIYFCNEYWPDFSPHSLTQAIEWFMHRERRFGKTSEQIREL